MAYKPKEIYCQGCNHFVGISNFYKHKNKYHAAGVHFYCKECTRKISKEIMGQHVSLNSKADAMNYELAIRHICSFFDMPFISEVCVALRDEEVNSVKAKDWDYVVQYGKKLKELGYDEELYWNNLSGNSFLAYHIIKEKDTKPNSEGDAELFISLEKDWGAQDSLDDYIWLLERFNEYTQGEQLTPSMKNTMKYLCLAELEVLKLKKAKEDTKDVEKKVMAYYKTLGLDKFKLKENKTEIEKTLENWAWIQENIEPLDWEDENLTDRLGISRDYDDIMRSLGNKVVGSKDYPKLSLEDVNKSKK